LHIERVLQMSGERVWRIPAETPFVAASQVWWWQCYRRPLKGLFVSSLHCSKLASAACCLAVARCSFPAARCLWAGRVAASPLAVAGRISCGVVTSRVAAALLLLVELLLQWSLDANVAVTDVIAASMSEASIFILVLLGGAITNGHWSCYGDQWLGSACVAVQTTWLQAAVYK
jgi:hypothetical protein